MTDKKHAGFLRGVVRKLRESWRLLRDEYRAGRDGEPQAPPRTIAHRDLGEATDSEEPPPSS